MEKVLVLVANTDFLKQIDVVMDCYQPYTSHSKLMRTLMPHT